MNGAGDRNYDDIINTQWPPVADEDNNAGRKVCNGGLREPMRLENRAKIFLPFAALTGFEDEVEGRLRDEIARMDEKAGKIQFDGAVMDQIYWD